MSGDCKICRLHKACEHFKGPFCPWLLYVILIVVISIPAYLIWNIIGQLNI